MQISICPPLYWEANSYYPRGLKLLREGHIPTPQLNKTEGFQCLGHSNWTICTLLSQFYFPNFTTFSLSYWEANSYYPRGLIMRKGNSYNSRNGLDRGVSVPGAFKLDHLQPVKPILFSKFCNFFTFILGANFLLPESQ